MINNNVYSNNEFLLLYTRKQLKEILHGSVLQHSPLHYGTVRSTAGWKMPSHFHTFLSWLAIRIATVNVLFVCSGGGRAQRTRKCLRCRRRRRCRHREKLSLALFVEVCMYDYRRPPAWNTPHASALRCCSQMGENVLVRRSDGGRVRLPFVSTLTISDQKRLLLASRIVVCLPFECGAA